MENEGIKILYIDDEKAALFNFEQLFQDDFDVFTAPSVDEGLEILASTEIQIVISDQRMPNKTGIEFFAEVAQLYPDTVRILLTAYSEAEIIIDAINRGQVYQYITKPFETKNLKNILDKAAQNWRLKRENKLLITQLQKKNVEYEVINDELRHTNDELYRSNKETEDSKNQIKYILQTAMDGFWMTDMNGYFINVNDAYCSMSGYTETELLTMHISDVEVNENKEDVELHIKNIIENGSDRFVSKHRRKDGRAYDVEISAIYQTEYKKAFVVFVRDITEQKKAEKALLESETQFRNLANSSSTLIWTSGTDKLCNYFNETWLKFTGRTLEQEMGNGWAEGVHPDDFDRCLATYISAFNKQEAFEMEYRLLHVSGEYKWILDMGTPNFNSNNEFIGYIGNCYDINERKETAKALEESENRLSTIFKNDPTGIFIVHEKTQIIYDLNDTALKIFGLQKEEIIGKECRKFFCQAENGFCPICELGQSLDQSERVLFKPDGTKVPILKSVAPIIMNGENYLLESFIDISDLKKGEKLLAESERRFRELLSTVEMISVILDIEGNIVYCNNHLLKLTDWKKEEILGKNWFSTFLSSEIIEDVSAVFHEAIINRNILTNYENTILTKNGTEILVSWNNTALYDENGELISIASLGVDITKRKMAEMELADSKKRLQQALEVSNQSRITLLSVLEDQLRAKETLRESEEKLSTLFNSMTEMVVMHELVFNEKGEAINYRILDCNKTFSSITGIEKENAIGRLATEVYEIETAPYLQEYANVALNGTTFEFNTFYPPLDKYFLISVVSSEKNKFSTISTDITSNEQIHEIIKEKNKELENYLYVASHDLRSPLVNIQGFSQRLIKQTSEVNQLLNTNNFELINKPAIEKISNVDIPKSIDFILSNITKMDTLINGLLQVSRTGRIAMSITEIDMKTIFTTVLNSLNFELTEVNAKVLIGEIDNCYGDENQLFQVFSNLVGNALKYRNKDKTLTIELNSEVRFNKVVYSVKDNGIGINERHINKIWDIFYRVNASELESGEGLGLSLVKKIVEKHGGKVWVQSEPDVGSTFFVELSKTEFKDI